MRPLKALFIVQGEGRGHMTQALALASMLSRAGHRVCSAVVSHGGDTEIPTYFEENLDAPVTYAPSGRFIVDPKTRSINWSRTLIHNALRSHKFGPSFAAIQQVVDESKPDVLVNFYEPLGGFYNVLYRPRIPMVAVAHQFMFMHPKYVFPGGFHIQKRSVLFFTWLTGLGAARRLALSLNDSPPLPGKRLVVMPPLLRDGFFGLPTSLREPYYLVYLFHHSLAQDVVAWHRRHPEVALHCFWNNPAAEETTHFSETLTFHRLHGQRFLDMLARCEGIVTTAGFETMAEAMYLAKPLMLNPLNRHFEQHCNAVDGTQAGAAVESHDFDLDRLVSFVKRYNYDATPFRAWVQQAEEMFVREIEYVCS